MRILPFCLVLCIIPVLNLSAQPRREQPRRIGDAVRDAESIASRGDYDRAIGILESALDSVNYGEPRTDALFALTRMDLATHRYVAAYTASRTFLNEYPNDYRAGDVLYAMAISAYEGSQPAESELAFRRLAADRRGPHAPAANYWIARISADAGRDDTAEVYADRAVNAMPHEYNAEALYLDGWLKERRGKIDTAALLYARVLSEYPTHPVSLDARLRSGVVESRLGHHGQAMTILKSVTPVTERQSEEHLYYLGEVSAALHEWTGAMNYSSQFLQRYPGSRRIRQARYNLGWSQRSLERYDEAIASFRQLESVNDSLSASAGYQIGAIHIRRGDTALALAAFQSLVARLPYESFSDDAYFQIARIHFRRAAYDSAAHYFLIVARQFPESDLRGQAYYLLGEAHSALRDHANAQVAFGRVARYTADMDLRARAAYREAIALYRLGRFHSAIARLRGYVTDYADRENIADATFWLGEALYQDRSYAEAERYYGVALEKYPASRWRAEAAYGIAWAQLLQKHFQKAAESFRRFIADYPDNDLKLDATLALANCYRYAGRYDEAISTYKSVGSISGGARAEEAGSRLAEVLLDMKQTDKAIETYRDLIRTYPNSELRDEYAFNIGVIYRDTGNDTMAVSELKKFLTEYPKSELLPQALFTIGDAYYNIPLYDSAVTYYRRVLDEHPNSAVVPEALDAVRFALEGAGHGGDAVALIDSFQQRNPDRLPPDSLAFRKSTILYDQAEFMRAIEVNRTTLTAFPETKLRPAITYQLARCYDRVARSDSAILLYTEVIEKYDTSSAAEQALMSRAALYLHTSALPEAVRDFRAFVRKYPASDRVIEAHYQLGFTSMILKDTATALEEFRSAVAAYNPNDTLKSANDDVSADHSRVGMGKIFISRRQNDSALAVLAPVFAHRLDDIAAEALLLHADLLTTANDLEGAKTELKRLTIEFTDYTEFAEPGILLLAKLYERQNDRAAARELYTKLISTTKDAKRKKEAETRLKKLK